MGNMNADRRSVPTRAQRRRLALATRPAVESFILIVATALVALEGQASLAGDFGPYLGAAFDPYVGQWTGTSPNAKVPYFNSYSNDSDNGSVQNQVNLVAPHFSRLATYGAGTRPDTTPTTPLDQLDSNWKVADAAANYNKRKASLAVTVSQGIYQQVMPQNSSLLDATKPTQPNTRMQIEIDKAFEIAKGANATFPGTVNRLIFTDEYVRYDRNDPNALHNTANQVDTLITACNDKDEITFKGKANSMGLQVGVRMQPEPFDYLNDAAGDALRQLVKDVDFIMLDLYPSHEENGVDAGATEVEKQYYKIKNAINAQGPNPPDVLIGETGWPSSGISFNDTDADNTPANEQDYFNMIKTWANQKEVVTHFFMAIDAPWKSNQNQSGGDPWTGPNGAEGHYGIWKYTTSDPKNGQFDPKFIPK